MLYFCYLSVKTCLKNSTHNTVHCFFTNIHKLVLHFPFTLYDPVYIYEFLQLCHNNKFKHLNPVFIGSGSVHTFLSQVWVPLFEGCPNSSVCSRNFLKEQNLEGFLQIYHCEYRCVKI